MAGGRNPGIRMLSARITGAPQYGQPAWRLITGTAAARPYFPVPGNGCVFSPFLSPLSGGFWVSAEKSLTFANEPNLPAMKIRGFFALLWAGLLALLRPCRAARRRTVRQGRVPHRHARQRSPLHGGLYAQGARRSPVIIFRTPYGCGPYGAGRFPQGFEKGYLRSYVDRGYIIVMQDVRGRYMSEGDFEHVRPPAAVRPTRRPTATTRSTGWSGTSRTTTVGWVSPGVPIRGSTP
ncbi:MAG: CocE/NonD family hydrolase [Alistipes onderdonkii]